MEEMVDVEEDGWAVVIETSKAAGGQDPSYSSKEMPAKPEADFPGKNSTNQLLTSQGCPVARYGPLQN